VVSVNGVSGRHFGKTTGWREAFVFQGGAVDRLGWGGGWMDGWAVGGWVDGQMDKAVLLGVD
jgi:hypothetical protein